MAKWLVHTAACAAVPGSNTFSTYIHIIPTRRMSCLCYSVYKVRNLNLTFTKFGDSVAIFEDLVG